MLRTATSLAHRWGMSGRANSEPAPRHAAGRLALTDGQVEAILSSMEKSAQTAQEWGENGLPFGDAPNRALPMQARLVALIICLAAASALMWASDGETPQTPLRTRSPSASLPWSPGDPPMKFAPAVAASIAVASQAHAQAAAVQWRIEDGGNGHWYQGRTTRVNWQSASDQATAVGGHLATCTSAAENQFVRMIRDSQCLYGGAWIGMRSFSPPLQPIGDWRWVTGEPVSWSNWYPGEPNGADQSGAVARVVELCCYGDRWGDWNEDFLLPFVIEWSADCNGDGVTDYGQIRAGALPDIDDDGVPDFCECWPADLTQDGQVGGADLGAMLAFWGPTSPVFPQADLNGDGVVNGADLSALLARWGPCVP